MTTKNKATIHITKSGELLSGASYLFSNREGALKMSQRVTTNPGVREYSSIPDHGPRFAALGDQWIGPDGERGTYLYGRGERMLVEVTDEEIAPRVTLVRRAKPAAKPLFERHLAGPSNRGVRAAIRATVEGHYCGPTNARRVRALARRVAFTAKGLAALEACAKDYESVSSYRPTCGCPSCYDVNLAAVKARHGN